jgi:hypothetical protein
MEFQNFILGYNFIIRFCTHCKKNERIKRNLFLSVRPSACFVSENTN